MLRGQDTATENASVFGRAGRPGTSEALALNASSSTYHEHPLKAGEYTQSQTWACRQRRGQRSGDTVRYSGSSCPASSVCWNAPASEHSAAWYPGSKEWVSCVGCSAITTDRCLSLAFTEIVRNTAVEAVRDPRSTAGCVVWRYRSHTPVQPRRVSRRRESAGSQETSSVQGGEAGRTRSRCC